MKGHSCLIMLMKQDLCAAISNPSGYTVVGEWSKQPCPEGRHTPIKWGGMHNPEMEADAEKKARVGWSPPRLPTPPLSRFHGPNTSSEKTTPCSVAYRCEDRFLWPHWLSFPLFFVNKISHPLHRTGICASAYLWPMASENIPDLSYTPLLVSLLTWVS